jgi:ribosomal protein S18 acetylase RimI-like enzyme
VSALTGPPEPVTIRPATPADLADVVHLRQAQELVESGTTYTTLDQLRSDWEALDSRLAEQVRVAVAADGRVLAGVEVVQGGDVLPLHLWILPDRRGTGLESALLAMAEQQARMTQYPEGTHSVTLFTQVVGSNPAVEQALQQARFVTVSTYEEMELDLKDPPATPEGIAGIVISPFVTGQDAEAIYRADEEAFQDERGSRPRTFDQWTRRLNMREQTDDPPVWMVAWDANEVAGATLGEVIKDVGWIHHVGVRRPWRKQGLGRALTLAALGAFYRQNIHTVRLNVDAESLTHAQVLYRHLGFQVLGTYTNCTKVLLRNRLEHPVSYTD